MIGAQVARSVTQRPALAGLAAAAGKFSPALLGDGLWLDAIDINTQYQDNTGSTPGAIAQAVGLMLDKSQGAPRILLFSDNFDAGIGNWTSQAGDGAASANGGSMRVARVTSAASGYRAVNLTAGKTYEFIVWARQETGTAIAGLNLRDAANTSTSADLGNTTTTSLTLTMLRIVYRETVTATRYIHLAAFTNAGQVKFEDFSYSEIPGNHLSQATPANRWTLSGRVNRFLRSQDFNAGTTVAGSAATPWEYSAGGINIATPNTTIAPDGTMTGDTVQITATAHVLRQVVAVTPGETVRFLWYAKDATFAPKYSVFNVTGSAEIVAPSAYPAGVADRLGWTRYAVDVVIPAGCTSAAFYPLRDSGAASGTIALWGADLRGIGDARSGLPPYQRVNTSTDYDTAGFPLFALLDGVNHFATATTGGGGNTGFMFCAAATVLGGAGADRVLFSDVSGNSGYCVQLTTLNVIRLIAGNGAAFTVADAGTWAVGETHVVALWDDGVSLKVQVDFGAIASVPRPAVAAGTAGFTVGRANGVASGPWNGRVYAARYVKGTYPGDALRVKLQRAMAARAMLTI